MKRESKLTRNEKITLTRLMKAGKSDVYIAAVLGRSVETIREAIERQKRKAAEDRNPSGFPGVPEAMDPLAKSITENRADASV